MNNITTEEGAVFEMLPSEFKNDESLSTEQAGDNNSVSSSTPSVVSFGDSSIDDGESSSS